MQKKQSRPPKEERDAVRRARIVASARRCAVRSGFHAMSMAVLAQEAGMSVGQIYRHFPGKEAIVEAVIEDFTVQRLHAMLENLGQGDEAERLVRKALLDDEASREARALLLEVQAEAMRNGQVAVLVRRADQRLRQSVMAGLQAHYPSASQADVGDVVELVASLIEGMQFRHGVRDSGADVIGRLALEVIQHQLGRLA